MHNALATNSPAHTAAIIPASRSLNAAMLSKVRDEWCWHNNYDKSQTQEVLKTLKKTVDPDIRRTHHR